MMITNNTIKIGNYSIDITITTNPYNNLHELEYFVSKEGSNYYCKGFDSNLEEAYNWCIMQDDFKGLQTIGENNQ